MTNLAFPYGFSPTGRTATCDDERHVRQLIEQVLLTSPGERVNRPTFGCGLLQLVFEPASDALVAALRVSIQASLQQWLGDLIEARSVELALADGSLEITVTYTVRRTGQLQSHQILAGGVP